MKKNNLRFLILTLIGIFIFSCQNEDIYNTKESTDLELSRTENFTKLGRKLENPYSITNMQRAMDTILTKLKQKENYESKSYRKSAEEIEIEKTDLYIRFLPKDSLELNIIEKDTLLILYNHPLDYEIEKQGEFYHDPEIPEDQISWKYAVVKPDYEFPEVEHEVLSELFIPENHPSYTVATSEKTSKSTSDITLDNLETVSLFLTGNLPEEEIVALSDQSASAKGRACIRIGWIRICWNTPDSWNPSGNISLWDDELERAVPMHGVKVRARRWFTTKIGITDANGDYRTGSFKRKVNYSINWERHHFSVKTDANFYYLGWFGFLFEPTAKYNGPKQKSPWNLEIRGGTQQYYATIFQAAHDYYYRHSFGLTKPSRYGGFWKMRLKARLKNGRSSYVKARRLFNGSDISIQEWGRDSEFVYGTTIHELAHAAHRKIDGSAYNSLVWNGYSRPCSSTYTVPGYVILFNCDNPDPKGANSRRVMETWATAVEITLTNLRYNNYLRHINYEYRGNLQDQTIAEDDFYTTVGFDLIDDDNQRVTEGVGRPIDRVDGYTIKDVENALRGAKTWEQWRDNMIDINPSNPTSGNIEELFNNY